MGVWQDFDFLFQSFPITFLRESKDDDLRGMAGGGGGSGGAVVCSDIIKNSLNFFRTVNLAYGCLHFCGRCSTFTFMYSRINACNQKQIIQNRTTKDAIPIDLSSNNNLVVVYKI